MKIKEDILIATLAALKSPAPQLAVLIEKSSIRFSDPVQQRGASVFAIYEVNLPHEKVEEICRQLQALIDLHGYAYQFENRQLNFILTCWQHSQA